MKNRRTRAGESFAETLVAVLIMSVTFLMLTTAIVAAAHITSLGKNEDATLNDTAGVHPITVTVDGNPVAASLHETENGYYYYEYTP